MYDRTSPLSQQLQEYLWSPNYKPRMLLSNPRKFLASYETEVISAGGDALALASPNPLIFEKVEKTPRQQLPIWI